MEVREGRVKCPGYTAEEVVRWAYNKDTYKRSLRGRCGLRALLWGFTVNRDYGNILKQRVTSKVRGDGVCRLGGECSCPRERRQADVEDSCLGGS